MQLELDLGDKLIKFSGIAQKMILKLWYQTNRSVCIYSSNDPNVFWLGTRTFNYDTEYTYDHKIDYETAKYLYEKFDIYDFNGNLEKRIKQEKIMTCKICGCETTKQEIKEKHLTCFIKD